MNYKGIRGYLVTGLLVWLPIWATLAVIRFIVRLMDNSMSMLPTAYHPDILLGVHVPGVGIVVSVFVVLGTGIFATNFIGKRIVYIAENLVGRIPLVRTIYNAVKQVAETIFADNSNSFRKVVLIEYPRKGIWSIGFLTGSGVSEIDRKTGNKNLVVFVPTTPNPTSGFIMAVPKSDIVELNMSVDEALKMVISLGVVQPE